MQLLRYAFGPHSCQTRLPHRSRRLTLTRAVHNNGDYVLTLASIAGKNHYQVLGLHRNATPQEIKSAFRQLAHKYHPDVNKSPDSAAVFKSVRLAYEVLSDENKRNDYNRTLRPKEAPKTKTWTETTRQAPDFISIKYGIKYERSRVNSNMSDADARNRYGRRRRRFTPRWIRKLSKEEDEFDTAMREGDSFEEWQKAPSTIFTGFWILAVIWQIFGTRIALAVLGLSMCSRNDITVGYKLALGVTLLMGGAKGVLVALMVLLSTSWGGAYNMSVFTVVLGIWLRDIFLPASVYLPPPILLLMAFKLAGQRSD